MQTPGCWDGDGAVDPSPSSPGYYLPTYSPANCFSPTGAGINDADRDGMDERCEEKLAQVFRPVLNLAPANQDCDMGMEPYWAAKYFPSHGKTVRIMYLMGYYQDCGSNGSLANTIGQILGQFVSLNNVLPSNLYTLFVSDHDATEGHSGDSEFIAVDVMYNPLTQHWYATGLITSAHWGTNADGTRRTPANQIEWGETTGTYPAVWVAANKHANYPTRSACNSGRGFGGFAKDNCDANLPKVTRVYNNASRNVGSFQQNFITPGTCVKSQNRPTLNAGTECLWKLPTSSDVFFFGWNANPVGEPPTAYGVALLMLFECYQLSQEIGGACIDQGVVR